MPGVTREVHANYSSDELMAAVHRYPSDKIGKPVAVRRWAELRTDYDDYFYEFWLALDDDLPEKRVEAVAGFLKADFDFNLGDFADSCVDSRTRV